MEGWKNIDRRVAAAIGVGVVALGAVAGSTWWWPEPSAPPSAFMAAQAAEPFAALDCQARTLEASPALAVMFNAPVDAKQNLAARLSVLDLGLSSESPSRDKSANPPTPQYDTDVPPTATAVKTAWVVGDNPRILYLPHIKPQHRYRVTLDSSIAAAGGKATLEETQVCEILATPMPASYYFASKGTVLPAKQNGGLPIVTVNVPEVDIQFLRVEPAQMPRFLERIAGRKKREPTPEEAEYGYYDEDYRPRKPQGAVSGYELDTLRQMSKSVYLGRFLADARPNRRNVTHIPVEDIEELQAPGIYIAVMSEPGKFSTEFQTTYFYVSDIGIHVRRYGDSLEAYSTSLRTGKALSGTEFKLLDEDAQTLGSATANSDGHARFAIKTSRARVLLAKRGDDFSLLSLMDPALDLSEFDTAGHLSRPIKIFAYAGRDLYRPGETLEASILVRDEDGQPVPPSAIAATLKRADGKTVQQFVLNPEPGLPGFLRAHIALPMDAQTGTWALELRADPAAKTPDHSMKLQVEEFLPERMKLDLKTAQPFLAPGNEFDVEVQGDYLYGAPAFGNQVKATAVTERQRIPFPKLWPGFEYGDFDDDGIHRRQEINATELDVKGQALLEVPVSDPANSPLSIRAVVSLLESGGRPVVRSIERTLWPAEKMIAVRPLWSGKFVQNGAPAEFEVIRTNREGEFAPLEKATMRLYREEREYYWVFDDQRGWHSGYTQGNELLESFELNLGKRTRIAVPTTYGRYRIEIADAETGHTLRYQFFVGWGAQDAELIGNRPDRVRLKLDKSSYAPGETAKLHIAPPNDGEALVLVEGNGALWQRRVGVSAKGTDIDIPIGKDWRRHDLYVSVVAFRPGSRRAQVTPARSLGLIYLPIAEGQRNVDVKLELPTKTQPEREVSVRVKAPALQNQAAIVTVSAVDVGILNITRFDTPDAFEFFLGKQRYQPDALDLYGKLIETMEGGKGQLKFGGDTALRETRSTPKKLKMVDLYSGPVKLNAAGEAEVTLKLPDFNGTLRVMAVVASANKFGKAEAELVSAAPIVAELSTPRFVVPGDVATVSLDLTNMTTDRQDLRVAVRTLGPLKIAANDQRVQLKPQEKKTLRLNVEATSVGAGELSVEVQNKTKDIALKRHAPLNVSPIEAHERSRVFVRMAPGEEYKVDTSMLGDFYADSALVSLTFSTVPPINVSSMVHGLFTYPYGCLEQTTSRAFPHVLIDEKTAEAFGLRVLPRPEREHALNEAIGRLAGMQRANGAFSLWGNGVDEIWLSAYVAEFFKTARKAGYSVPEDLLKKNQDWMLKQLQQASGSFPPAPPRPAQTGDRPADSITHDAQWLKSHENRATVVEGHRRLGALAYMGYILAQDDNAPLSALRSLHDDYRDRARSPLPLVHLALALKKMGDEKRFATALDAAFATPYGIDQYWSDWLGDYGSKLRDTAMVLALLDSNGIQHPRKENMRGELLIMLKQQRWLSTQEQLALLLAAKSFAGSGTAKNWQALVTSGKHMQDLAGTQSAMREFDSAAVKRGVRIVNTGKESLYLEVEASGYPVKPRDNKADTPILLRHTLYQADGKPVGDRVLEVGEQLMMHVEVLTKHRIEDGLVVDRVPAGLEVENLNIAQGNRLTDFKTPERGTPERWKYDYGYYWRYYQGLAPKRILDSLSDPRVKHREYRDDRFVAAARLEGPLDLYYLVRVVTPGQYTIPPAFAEDMYRPELRSSGPIDKLTVAETK